jgi:hypothetical protein
MLILTGLGASALSLIESVNTEPHPQSSDDSSLVACAYFVGRSSLSHIGFDRLSVFIVVFFA